MNLGKSIETIIKRDRVVLLTILCCITALAWWRLFQMKESMASMSIDTNFVKTAMMTSNGANLYMTFIMWAVMMVGMMVPSATPMILVFAQVNRKRSERGAPFVPTGIFFSGYLICWALFSLFAAMAQVFFFDIGLLNPYKQAVTPLMGALLLIAAGMFQLTSFKNSCLQNCRTPLDFLTSEWREGYSGALIMGLRHGLFCIGCCWLLMALLFVAGVMNLLWVALLTFFVLAEKVLPWRNQVVKIGAGGCLASGIALLGWILIN